MSVSDGLIPQEKGWQVARRISKLRLALGLFAVALAFTSGYLYSEANQGKVDAVTTYNDGFTDALCQETHEGESKGYEDGAGNVCEEGGKR
ncbi:hypothetical protein ABZ369_33475 [Streptomyces sp. NPDC005918]|uniref:hypothetical protein n=1 Tax=Streptomyces sp. NPDC005918 TaxID=3155454 RepID=UPI0033EEE02B